ncbi:MAG: aldehyde dehydrogenase family protein [Peptostreptococcus sp.]|uniref:aldehyde dehydrogenase family protein n=1 Tax=Peptostreptococcus TaxID=1257 RepID=UPI00189925C5|nr:MULTISPECIES: aldehyde dehydrogenase family protein [Peptostreptococcus]MCB6983680.1 aldehyde dehydrogenase family protein [Peptostreptococcus anaerobius]MCQ5151545.1 aldehyde dehydrogenase family protein [Peptostreptococcus anaerobius]MDB8820975.1 aldehyde dehydrogenase family protein [Peptostreptococcus anaerobius]MDB8826250.1 aldehyde dehydrogenase family protein [Peptostreptococcus anaerobius]MDB8827310.1 aldehyde dehydrogenase family protein [Peptostreptococcus anaerobius]
MSILTEKRYKLFIDGQWLDSSDNTTLRTTNPANGEFLAEIADATNEDVDRAVKAARKAFETWSQTTTAQRADILDRIAARIEENAEFLATVETMDNGKPIRETKNVDIPLAADHFKYFAGVIRSEEGSANVLDGNKLSIVLREPIGVVGQIVPWNFPFLMAAWKLAPVIAAGDTTILKPSSSTSLSILELMKIIEDLIPAGVINIVTGKGSRSGDYLVQHEGIDKLAFTGSTEVGRNIGIEAAKRIIPATLELGGKSANIFFDDCDIEQALDGVQLGILFNQGQVCCAGSRIFVQEGIYDEFVEKAIERFKNVKVGDPLDESTQMGAQVNVRQAEKILGYVENGKKEGARVAVGGQRACKIQYSGGAFVEPTLLVDVTNDMAIAQEEIFGPVGVVIKFKDADDVVRMANQSVYGLGGGVYTKNIDTALDVARRVKTGRIWVNTYNQIPAGAPFGGIKQSGIGRETHKMILDSYTQAKNIMIDLTGKGSGFY